MTKMTDCVWQNISIEIPDKPENTFRFGSRAEHDLSTGGEYSKFFLSCFLTAACACALFKITTIADQFMVETICLIFKHEHFFRFWQLFYKIICRCFEIFSLILKCECWGLILKGVFQEYWQNMRRWPHLDVEEYQTSVFPPEQIE